MPLLGIIILFLLIVLFDIALSYGAAVSWEGDGEAEGIIFNAIMVILPASLGGCYAWILADNTTLGWTTFISLFSFLPIFFFIARRKKQKIHEIKIQKERIEAAQMRYASYRDGIDRANEAIASQKQEQMDQLSKIKEAIYQDCKNTNFSAAKKSYEEYTALATSLSFESGEEKELKAWIESYENCFRIAFQYNTVKSNPLKYKLNEYHESLDILISQEKFLNSVNIIALTEFVCKHYEMLMQFKNELSKSKPAASYSRYNELINKASSLNGSDRRCSLLDAAALLEGYLGSHGIPVQNGNLMAAVSVYEKSIGSSNIKDVKSAVKLRNKCAHEKFEPTISETIKAVTSIVDLIQKT